MGHPAGVHPEMADFWIWRILVLVSPLDIFGFFFRIQKVGQVPLTSSRPCGAGTAASSHCTAGRRRGSPPLPRAAMLRAVALFGFFAVLGSGARRHYLQSVAPVDLWSTGDSLISIDGRFDGDSRYKVMIGNFVAPPLESLSDEGRLVVVSPMIDEWWPTADFDVVVKSISTFGVEETVPWSASALPVHKKVRIHNYQETIAAQLQVTEAAQLELLSSASVPEFNKNVLLKTFFSPTRDDHTLCGIGGDDITVCPSFEGEYQIIRVEGLCARELQEGTIPLRLYRNERAQDNAAVAKRLRSLSLNYELVHDVCYMWRTGAPDRAPLELFYNKGRKDYMSTATSEGRAWARAHNYTSAGTQGYVQRLPERKVTVRTKQARDLLGAVDRIMDQLTQV